jgi:acetyl esterase/lipase
VRQRLFRDWPLAALNGSLSMRRIKLTADIQYGEHHQAFVDLYAPDTMNTSTPVVIFFYGGRWQQGCRQDYKFVAQALASHGVCCLVPDYRRFPEVQFPGFVQDAASALLWAAQNIEAFGGSPDNLMIMGHSAGAHISSMLALNPDYRQAFDQAGYTLKGFIGISGPYDFLPIRDLDILEVFGDKAKSMESQPVHYASSQAPPTLLLTSKLDIVVRQRNAHRLAKALTDFGVSAETKVYPNLTHAGTVLALAGPLRWRAPVLDHVLTFIRHHAGAGACK